MNKYIKLFLSFLMHIIENHKLIKTLIINNFKKEYLGSYLGLVWAFVQPLTFILVIWFVFTYGFRTPPTSSNTPYFLWLISGMIPWFFITNALSAGTNAIVANSFLVKKVFFRVSILPLIQIGSALIIHSILVLFLIIMFLLYGYKPSIYWIQLLYFILCSVILVLGISWITSSVRVFVKDMSNVINVLIQIGFWATPIFWNVNMISQKHQWIIKLNPAYYIVEGFRNSLINHIWFWEMKNTTLYFLFITTVFFILGAIVFRRLRPHFGDVL
ncbi:MAG: ABC transporter permease [Campylobacteraceae bacterium]|nr:ABC transporter permease [Campylobacteraceae bacterium]